MNSISFFFFLLVSCLFEYTNKNFEFNLSPCYVSWISNSFFLSFRVSHKNSSSSIYVQKNGNFPWGVHCFSFAHYSNILTSWTIFLTNKKMEGKNRNHSKCFRKSSIISAILVFIFSLFVVWAWSILLLFTATQIQNQITSIKPD